MFLTTTEVATFLNVPLKRVYYLLYTGALEGCKIRRSWRIFSYCLRVYKEQNAVA